MSKVISRADLNALPQACRTNSSGAPTSCRKAAADPLPFAVMAYAFGQFCLPYLVKVSHRRRPRGFHVVGSTKVSPMMVGAV